MKLSINGSDREVPDGLSVAALITHLGLNGPVAVERNREVVPRAEHVATKLEEGDRIEIVHFVGGG
ncbi:MAG: sulfur carrier protein ThiS [Polyangiales bacterium]